MKRVIPAMWLQKKPVSIMVHGRRDLTEVQGEAVISVFLES
jgi:hypothetical protein